MTWTPRCSATVVVGTGEDEQHRACGKPARWITAKDSYRCEAHVPASPVVDEIHERERERSPR